MFAFCKSKALVTLLKPFEKSCKFSWSKTFQCMTACSYHVTQQFQIESTLYSLPECQETPCFN